MQTVLITGATSGIGLYIANHLHKNGFKVYGTSRKPESHKSSVPFELLELDITSETSILNCVDTLLSTTQVLDVLINNAGMSICGSVEETTIEQAQSQFDTNFWGSVKVTKAVLPIMREHHSGKIITIGSLAGLIGVPFQSYYAASKHSLEGFFKSLRYEVKSFNIKVSIIEPGFFKTNLHQSFVYAEPKLLEYDTIRNNALQVLEKSIEDADLPVPVAKVGLKILKSKNPGYSYRVGHDARILPVLQFLFYRLFESGTLRKFNLIDKTTDISKPL